LFYITVEAEFDLVSAEDGSKHTARTFGEAMDSGDKGTNKAMSAAYKYMAFQTFAIPTEGDNDADGHTHNVVANKPTLDAKRLQGAIDKILAGQYTTEKLRDTFTLTAAQDKQLIEALANA
jgi:hypothetical protein